MHFSLILFPLLSFQMTLYYEAFTDPSFVTSEDWTVSNALSIYSNCAGTRILGGYNAFGNQAKAIKLLQLPPHHTIYITMQFWRIDSWDNEFLYIYLDGTLSLTAQYGQSGIQQCGAGWGDDVYSLTITQPHVFQSVVILITTNLNSQPNDESWGFRDFKLYLDLCPLGCQSCSEKDQYQECKPWNLISSAFLSDQLASFQIDGWSIINGIQDTTVCSNIPLFGGYTKSGQSSIITANISMPQHFLVKIRFRTAYIDSWDGESFYCYIDGNRILNIAHNHNSGGFRDYCGSNSDDYLANYQIIMFHKKSNLIITFSTTLNEGVTNESYGMRDFEIFTYDSQDCGNGLQEQNEQCDDGNIYAFDGCFNCQYSCVEGCSNCIDGICFECDIGWIFYSDFNSCIAIIDDTKFQIWEECDDYLDYEICLNGKFICPFNCKSCSFGICIQCKSNYQLINNKCESICQNQLIVNDIQCMDYNLQAFDKCHQCYYDLEQGCQLQLNGICIQCLDGWILDKSQYICIPKCGDLIIKGDEQCDINKYRKQSFGCNQCEFDCQDECINCQFGKCYDCIQGWKLKNYYCESDCGNNSIQGLEECDDMNQIRFDGCNNCRNDCQRECSYCQRGMCLDCIYGWHLTDYFICESECGDNQIALISIEECEDSNYDQFDGCYQCKIECCHYCDVCVYGYCYHCEYTFTLIDQYCIPVCGDGLITIGYEQCDDMNEIPYDGCYNCNYQCRQYCKLCIKGICYDQCEYGYYQFDYECYPICGDGIIVEQEDCDDQNDDQSDGCYNCQFRCPDHCEICDQGKCKLCESGYALIDKMNVCKSYCGNGMVSLDDEECDDNNNDDGDGCSRFCKIEIDYQCKNYQYSFSQCTYSKQPRFYLQFREERDQKQYVSLLFTQQVKNNVQDYYSKYIQMNLIDMDINIYTLNLIIIQEAVDYLTNVEYLVEIQINSTLPDRPYLEVTLDEQLYNSDDAILFNQYDKILLKQPKYIDDQKQQAAATLNQANKYLMNSIGGIGILAFFLGNSFIFSSILEVLQQQSYLRFINVMFPFNLFIYFESSNIITIQPILQFFKVDSIATLAFDSTYIESYEKLKFYEINADLLTNIQTQVFLIIALIIIYYSCALIIYLIDAIQIQFLFFIGKFGFKLLFLIRKLCWGYQKEFQKDGLKAFLVANCWDLLFTCFLQLKSFQSNTTIKSIICLIFAYFIFYGCLLILRQFIYKNQLIKQSFCNYWISKMDLFFTLKKLIFIFILVCFQKNEQIQTILLTFVCQLYLSYAIKFKPVKNKQDFCNLIMMEGSACIFTFTSALYWSQMSNIFTYDNQVLLGWAHIILLLSVLLVNLFLSLFTMFLKFKMYVKKRLSKSNQKHQINSNPFPLANLMEFKL